MEVKASVAIVGAGPAGSTLAALLARRGVDVVLVDRDLFPRDKLCGEFLSYDALPILELLGVTAALDRHAVPAIHRCRVIGRGTTYDFDLPRAARGVSRLLLDQLLLDAARQAGAADRTGWTAVRVSGNSIGLTREGEELTVAARVVVGAWGRWGRFDAQLRRAFVTDQSHRNFGFKRHYRAASAPPADTIDLYSFRRGYLGASPIEGGLTNICGLVHTSRLTGLKGRWDSFVTTIQGEELALESLYAAHEPAQPTFLTSEPVIFRARSPLEEGIVMIGDASGVLDPLTGNGMAMAIQSAVLAAPFIERLLGGGERQAVENAYRTAHSQFFGARIRWSRLTAKVLSHPAVLEPALRLVRSRRPGQFLLGRTRAGDEAIDRIVSAWF